METGDEISDMQVASDAMQDEGQEEGSTEGKIGRRIFVSNLAWKVKWRELKAHFEPFGTVEQAVVERDPETGSSRGFGIVTFKKAGDANKALKALNGSELQGRPLMLEFAKRKPEEIGKQKKKRLLENKAGDSEKPSKKVKTGEHQSQMDEGDDASENKKEPQVFNLQTLKSLQHALEKSVEGAQQGNAVFKKGFRDTIARSLTKQLKLVKAALNSDSGTLSEISNTILAVLQSLTQLATALSNQTLDVLRQLRQSELKAEDGGRQKKLVDQLTGLSDKQGPLSQSRHLIERICDVANAEPSLKLQPAVNKQYSAHEQDCVKHVLAWEQLLAGEAKSESNSSKTDMETENKADSSRLSDEIDKLVASQLLPAQALQARADFVASVQKLLGTQTFVIDPQAKAEPEKEESKSKAGKNKKKAQGPDEAGSGESKPENAGSSTSKDSNKSHHSKDESVHVRPPCPPALHPHLTMFGSSACNLGTVSSDIDVALEFKPPSSFKSADWAVPRSEQKKVLQQTVNLLSKQGWSVTASLDARVPVIRIKGGRQKQADDSGKDKKQDSSNSSTGKNASQQLLSPPPCNVDIIVQAGGTQSLLAASMNHRKTDLLSKLIEQSPASTQQSSKSKADSSKTGGSLLQSLIVAVRHWAKQRQLSDSKHGGLNSFSWALLCVQLLQSRGLLSNTQQLLGGSSKTAAKSKSANDKDASKMTTASLLAEFFTFYTQSFNAAEQAVSVRLGKVVTRVETAASAVRGSASPAMVVEDPVDPTDNCARTVNKETLRTIRRELLRAVSLLSSQGTTAAQLFNALPAQPKPGAKLSSSDPAFHRLWTT